MATPWDHVRVATTYVMPYAEECPYKDLSGFTFIVNFWNTCSSCDGQK